MNKKFKFISKEAKEKKEKSQKDLDLESLLKEAELGEFEIAFKPGEQVYLIEDGRIVKRTVSQVNAHIKIRENYKTSDVLYILNDRPKKQYKADKLFSNMTDIPIVDDTMEPRPEKKRRKIK